MSDLRTRPIELVVSALDELAALDQWVVSKYVEKRDKDGNIKLDKPPFSPRTKRQCSHSNPAQLASYDDACAAVADFMWLGFVFHTADPYSGIDLDGCRDKGTGVIEEWEQRWIDALNSYTEISPSGTGVKIFVRGTLPKQLLHPMGEHKGIEVYSEKRYFTVTGQHLAGTPRDIRNAQSALDLMRAEYDKVPAPVPPRKEYKISKGEAANEHQNVREVIDRLNRTNNLGDYLEHRGGVLVNTRGDTRHYSGLSGDKHSHAITYSVSPVRGGNGQIGVSLNPNGQLSKTDFPHGFRWFAAICALEYGGVVIDALKALNPIAPGKRQQKPPLLESEYRTVAQVADADRKRADRRAAAEVLREAVMSRAAIDDALPWQAQALLGIHLRLAGQSGWHRKSVAHMAEILGKSERWVQKANEHLIDVYISRTTTTSHDTAIWTLLEKPIERVTMLETDNSGVIVFEAENDRRSPESIFKGILGTDQELVSGGRPARVYERA